MEMEVMFDRQLHAVLDSAPDGVLIESGDRIAYLNDSYAQLLGYQLASELNDATVRDIADPAEFDRLRWFGICRREGRAAPTRYTFHARARGGDVVTLDAS